MKLKVKISPSTTQSRSVEISILDDLGYTEAQWDALGSIEQLMEIDEYISNYDQPYWSVDSFDVIDDNNQQ